MTVRVIDSGELIKLRGDNQYSEVFAIPRVPNVICTATLATVPATHDMLASIDVENWTGDEADVRPDMKILVGTTAGSDDLGFCRIRKTPTITAGAGTLEISEISHIDFQAGCHITINDDYDIAPRHLKIVSGTLFIDYDVAYDEHHVKFQPIVNMGGHRVLILSGGTISHIRSAADSSVFDGTISSYLWESPDAFSITNGTTSAATFTYTSAGHFCEYLTITTNDGKTWTGVRYVFILPNEPTESNIVSLRIEESPIDGTSFNFEMLEDMAVSDFKHRAFVIVWHKSYYQGIKEYIYHQNQYEKNILACGRISEEKLMFNDEVGVVQFTAKNWRYWMTRISSFPFGVERPQSGVASTWIEMKGLNVDRAIWALLHEYCTVTRIADFFPSGDTRYAAEMSCINNNLASQVEEIALTSIYADLVIDRFSSCRLRIEPQLIPVANRSAWVTVQALTSNDYEDGLTFELNTYDEMSQVSLSGVSVSEFGAGNPHFSLSYGRVFSPFGEPSAEGNLLLESQTQANSLAGLIMGWRNRKFDAINIKFVGQNFMFSISEYCRASIVFSTSNNPRGISYNGNLIPKNITYEWDKENGNIVVAVTFEGEGEEKLSTTGDFPPDTGLDDLDFSFPPFPKIPPPIFPPPSQIPPGTDNPIQPKEVVFASGSSTFPGVYYATDFDKTSPVWKTMNTGLDVGYIDSDYKKIWVTPSGALWMIVSPTGSGGEPSWDSNLYRASGLGGEWKLVANANEVAMSLSTMLYPFDEGVFLGLGVNPNNPESVAVSITARKFLGAEQSYIGFASSPTLSIGAAWAGSGTPIGVVTSRSHGLIYLDGEWRIFYSSPLLSMRKMSGSGAAGIGYTIDAGKAAGHVSAVRIGDKYAVSWSDFGGTPSFYIVEDSGGATPITTGFVPRSSIPQSMAFSPSGLHGMGTGVAPHTPYGSSDTGATWSSLAGVIPAGCDNFDNCGDENRFVFGGGSVVRLTMDAGNTYLDKTGNLAQIAPFVDVCSIRYIR